jgi:hypothetical protein
MAQSWKKLRKIKKFTLEADVYEALLAKNPEYHKVLENEKAKLLTETNRGRTMIQINLRVPFRHLAAIEALTAERGARQRNKIILEALTNYLAQHVPWFAYDKSGVDHHVELDLEVENPLEGE